MGEQRTTPEQRAELWRRYEAALADIEATWPWQHALTIAAPALLADADALAGARATVGRLHALLRRCGPFLANYQCEDQREGDELIALEADIAAELGPEREGASE